MVPVVDKENKPLMPCTERRARKMIESGKATPFWSFGLWCIRLNVEPSERNMQDIACGIDPGSKREGFTVKSERKTFVNIQSKAVDWVKGKVETRRMLRRNRRSHKTPCRKPRWANRHAGIIRLAPSTKARWQLKMRVLKRLIRLFPIKYVVVEDVRAATKGGSIKASLFQMVMQGKNWLYEQIRNLDVVLMTALGYETSERRTALGLRKISDKLSNSFYAHCVDSWALASMAVGGKEVDNSRVLLVSPLKKFYRQLHVQNVAKRGIRKRYGSTLSMGFARGAIVRHTTRGVCLIGGASNGRLSLHDTSTNSRLCRNARSEDIKFLSFNAFSISKNGAQ